MGMPKDFVPSFEGGHRIITWAGMQCLPEWQKQLWNSELYNLSDVYSLYGDTYFTNKEEIGPFVRLPDGTVPQCAIGVLREKKHYGEANDYVRACFCRLYLYGYMHWYGKI